MTRAEIQKQRYLNTPCPRPGSRKKWKALGLSTDWVDRKMGTETRRMDLAEKRAVRPPTNKEGNLAAFAGMLKSLGGTYKVLRFKMKKKRVHTDGRRETQFLERDVKEISEDEAIKAWANSDQSAMRKKYKGQFWRDHHGTLRRVF